MNTNFSVQCEEATGSVPDPSLPLSQQLELALRKIQEHVRIIVETRATCKSLEEVIKCVTYHLKDKGYSFMSIIIFL